MIKYNIFTCLLTILGRDDVWRVSIRKKWYSLLLFFLYQIIVMTKMNIVVDSFSLMTKSCNIHVVKHAM